MQNALIQQECARIAYLEAMGVACFVSRKDLPGAAPSRRVQVAIAPVAEPQTKTAGAQAKRTAPPLTPPTAPPTAATPERASPRQPRKAPPLTPPLAPPTAASRAARQPPPQAAEPQAATEAPADACPPFAVALWRMGGWLWLEETLPGAPLEEEHKRLLRAIAFALGWGDLAVDPQRIDWPLPGVANIGQDLNTARDYLSNKFLSELERDAPKGAVLLGEFKDPWFDRGWFKECRIIQTVSAREMLRRPQLKRQAWTDLRGLRD